MKIVFVRQIDRKASIGKWRGGRPEGGSASFSPLAARQLAGAAENPLLWDCQLILASPHAGALQTAFVLSESVGADIWVEAGLRECLPGTDGHAPIAGGEGAEEMISLFDRYIDMGYQKLAAVAGEEVIRRYTGEERIAYCEVSQVEYTKDFICYK